MGWSKALTQHGCSHMFHLDLPLLNCRRDAMAVQPGKSCDACKSCGTLESGSCLPGKS